MYKIKDWPDDKKPRERLRQRGPESLELYELISVILGTGYKQENVIDLSKRILGSYGSREILGYKRVSDLMRDFQLPFVKACQLIACFELGRRLYGSRSGELPRVTSPEEVWQYVEDMHHLRKEHLRGLYLNTKHQIVHDETLSIGTLDQSIAHPRDIFSPALLYQAAAVIVVHNHPSGDTTPSAEDLALTKRLHEVGLLLSIPLIDHVIVTNKGFKSLI